MYIKFLHGKKKINTNAYDLISFSEIPPPYFVFFSLVLDCLFYYTRSLRVIYYHFPKTNLLFNKQLWDISNFRQLQKRNLTLSLSGNSGCDRIQDEVRKNRISLFSEFMVTGSQNSRWLEKALSLPCLDSLSPCALSFIQILPSLRALSHSLVATPSSWLPQPPGFCCPAFSQKFCIFLHPFMHCVPLLRREGLNEGLLTLL